MPTKLTYSIVPPTDVIACSASLDPDDISRATVKIEVRNLTGDPVTVDHIVLKVVVGHGADQLTANPASITPVAVDSGRWQLTAPEKPGVFRAEPIGAGTFEADNDNNDLDTTRFVLYDIEVVAAEGRTDLIVEEWTEEGQSEEVKLQIRKVYPALRIDEFSAAESKYAINAGEPVDLSWATTAATDVQIHDPLGAELIANPADPAQRDGTLKVTPQTTGSYTLIAKGGQGMATRQVTVTVRDRLELSLGDTARGTIHIEQSAPLPEEFSRFLGFAQAQRWRVVLSGPDEPDQRADLHVTGRISGDGSVPRGVIVMWHGKIPQIPDGWALCNGSKGTPDLRNRFVLGASNRPGRKPGKKGGAEEVTLTVAQMPGHAHGGATRDAGGHRHGVVRGTTGRALRIRHKSGDYAHTLETADSNFNDGAPISTDSAKDHKHAVEVEGGGEAHPNMPPFYMLAFIMKL